MALRGKAVALVGTGIAAARRVLLLAAAAGGAVLLLLPKPWALPTGPGFADPPGRPFPDMVAIALFWATALNALLCLGLAATARLWLRPLTAPLVAPPRRPLGRRVLLGLLLLAALAGALRWPLAGRSLWWDEGWSIDRVVVGHAVPRAGEPDRVDHRAPGWPRTLWYYSKPTNHVPYNLAGRAAIEMERAVSGRESWTFSDRAFRAPALLASMLAVVLLGLLVWRLGFPGAALAAAALLAIHPWHIRHGAEGRAYTFSVVAALAASALLLEALRGGRFRRWLAYGAGLTVLVWVQPAHAYLAVALGIAAVAAILTRDIPWRDRGALLLRFAVACGLAAMAFLELSAPLVSQALGWTDVVQTGETVNRGVVRRFWIWTALGVPARSQAESVAHDPFPSLGSWLEEDPWLAGVVFGALPLLAFFGLARVTFRGGIARWPVLGLAAAPGLLLLVSWTNRMYFYPRFAIYAVAAYAALAAIGAEGALSALVARAPARARRLVVPAGLALLLLAFQALVWPQTRVLLTRPYSPMRELAETLRSAGGLRAGFGLGGEMPRIYDPWIRHVESAREIAALEGEARAEGRPLHVFYGYPGQNRAKRPEGIARLLDPERYEEVNRFQGIEPQFTYRVFRLRADEGASSTP